MRLLLPLVTLALAVLPDSALASVLAIDYGAEFIKASLMKPGVPFDVLLNKDSKRKINSVVSWKNGDRLFGQDAFNIASRFPADSFGNLKFLEAVPFDAPIVDYYRKISSAALSETSRKTVALEQPDGTKWSVEELIAMQLAYIKHLAEEVAHEKVTDVVITVPAFYSQFERDAIADAIEISGLKTLALINDGTAVAINYAMTRTFPEPEHHIVYDAGASGIRASLIRFSTTEDKKGSPQTQISVVAVGHTREASGVEMDRRLREILIEAFNKKTGKDVRTDKRAMAKLWKETQRVKAILSTNTEAIAQVESLAWDIDFKAKVTRQEFEDACWDLQSHYIQPVHDALFKGDVHLFNVTSVITFGGASRTPMVQSALKYGVGPNRLAPNVNADEAAVLGAGLYGASLSRQFKTKNIKVSDILAHDILMSYAATASSSTSRPRVITSSIFPYGSKVGTKKTLTFKRKEDFSIQLSYKNSPFIGMPAGLLEVQIHNVTDAIANLTEAGAIDPVVKATISLSESGFISITDAVAYGEIKDDSITGKIKNFFGAGSSTETVQPEGTPSTETKEDTAQNASESTTASSTTASPATTEKAKKPVKPKDTIKLDLEVSFSSIPPMTVAEKKASRSRLRAVDQQEATKVRREEARNTLEGYLYRLRDLLNPDNSGTPFMKCSQPKERRVIEDKLDESFTWLNDRGDLAETSQLMDKRIALEALEKPIIHRYQEIEAFPQALNNSQMWNWSTRLFLQEARTNLTAELAAELPSKWTTEELDSLEKSLKDHESWLNEWVEKQKKVKMNEDPVIETKEMKARAKVLEGHLTKLMRRKVPKALKKKKVKPVEEVKEETQEDPREEERPHDEL